VELQDTMNAGGCLTQFVHPCVRFIVCQELGMNTAEKHGLECDNYEFFLLRWDYWRAVPLDPHDRRVRFQESALDVLSAFTNLERVELMRSDADPWVRILHHILRECPKLKHLMLIEPNQTSLSMSNVPLVGLSDVASLASGIESLNLNAPLMNEIAVKFVNVKELTLGGHVDANFPFGEFAKLIKLKITAVCVSVNVDPKTVVCFCAEA